jgi:hypothetical protein
MYWSRTNKRPRTNKYRGIKKRIKTNIRSKTKKRRVGGGASRIVSGGASSDKGLGDVNCNIANEKHDAGTCLPSDAIRVLTDEYNKDHPESPLNETDPKKILRKIMESVDCTEKDERCALGIINDVVLRKKYLKMLYAPNHPESWLKNPDEWLTNEDIDEILDDIEAKYPDFKAMRTTPIDFDTRIWGQCVEKELCDFSLKSDYENGKRRFAAVFNLDKHDQPGSHWVSLFVSVHDNAIVFFDSALGGVPPEISALVKRIQGQAKAMNKDLNMRFYTNKVEHQKGDTECGMYSIYFVTEMMADFKNLDMFMKGRINDETVFKMRKDYYNDPQNEVTAKRSDRKTK